MPPARRPPVLLLPLRLRRFLQQTIWIPPASMQRSWRRDGTCHAPPPRSASRGTGCATGWSSTNFGEACRRRLPLRARSTLARPRRRPPSGVPGAPLRPGCDGSGGASRCFAPRSSCRRLPPRTPAGPPRFSWKRCRALGAASKSSARRASWPPSVSSQSRTRRVTPRSPRWRSRKRPSAADATWPTWGSPWPSTSGSSWSASPARRRRSTSMPSGRPRACSRPSWPPQTRTALWSASRPRPFSSGASTSPLSAFAYRLAGRERSRVGPSGSRARFVGRRQDLDLLKSRLDSVMRGHGQVVGIVGEAGIGKSRLIFEFRQSVRQQPVTYLEGRCLSYASSVPCLPVLELLRQNFGIAEAHGPESIVEKVNAGLAAVGLEPEEWSAYLLQLLGVKEGTERLAGLSPEAIKSRTLEAMRRLSLRGSRLRPIVFVVEDLHWIDKSSEE